MRVPLILNSLRHAPALKLDILPADNSGAHHTNAAQCAFLRPLQRFDQLTWLMLQIDCKHKHLKDSNPLLPLLITTLDSLSHLRCLELDAGRVIME